MVNDHIALPGLPIFVINMARDVERRRYMTGVLGGLGLEAEFVTAVDGRQLSDAERSVYDRDRALRTYGVEMMPSEIGCYLSHHRLYQRMVRDGIEVALILEDDVRIEPTLPTVVRDLLACPFTDWLVVRLDCKRRHVADPDTDKLRGRRVAELSGGAALYRLHTHILGVGAYLIRREGAKRMIAYGTRVFMPIDHTMDRFWENGILPYVVRPFPVSQGDDFGTHSAGRTTDRRRSQPWPVRARRRLQRLRDGVRKRAFNLTYR